MKLTDEALTSTEHGLPYVFSQLRERPSPSKGQELRAMKDVLQWYKEWARDLFPYLKFDEFLEKVELLEKKARVRTQLDVVKDGRDLLVFAGLEDEASGMNEAGNSSDDNINGGIFSGL